MIFALIAAATLGVAPDSVLVRGAARDTTLFVVATPTGSVLRADVVLPLLGGAVRNVGGGRWSISVGGANIELADGVPYATHNGATFPLATAPVVRDGALLIPLDLLTGIAPRLGNNLMWDAGHRELRVFRGTVGRAGVGRCQPRQTQGQAVMQGGSIRARCIEWVGEAHGG